MRSDVQNVFSFCSALPYLLLNRDWCFKQNLLLHNEKALVQTQAKQKIQRRMNLRASMRVCHVENSYE